MEVWALQQKHKNKKSYDSTRNPLQVGIAIRTKCGENYNLEMATYFHIL